MKGKALFAILAAFGLATTAQAQLPPPEAIEQITPNTYKIFGGGGNTLVVVQEDGVVLVDTKMPGNGQAILDEVKKVTDKPIKAVINTHSHPDHIGSTDAIRAAYPNVQVIMHENTLKELSAGPGPGPNAGILPTITYSERMTIGQGDDRIELLNFDRAHTEGDTFVVVPSARLLFMGDVMAWNMAPFLPAGGAAALTEAVEELVATVKDVDIVVEGHGHVNTWDGLVLFSKFNRALLDGARAAYDRGDPPGVVVAELLKNPEFAPLLDTNIKKGLEYGNTPRARAHMNVNVAYLEFAGEPVGFGVANGAPLPTTDKYKGSDPRDTAAPAPSGR